MKGVSFLLGGWLLEEFEKIKVEPILFNLTFCVGVMLKAFFFFLFSCFWVVSA